MHLIRQHRRWWLGLPIALALASVAVLGGATATPISDASDTGPNLDAAKLSRDADSPTIDPAVYADRKVDHIARAWHSRFEGPPDDPVVFTGIFDGYQQVPFSADRFAMQNAWQDIVDGTLVSVWAGSHASDPDIAIIYDQGVVLVRRLANWPNPTKGDDSWALFEAPGGVGSLTIVSVADDQIVTVVDASGEKYAVDISTGTFANAS